MLGICGNLKPEVASARGLDLDGFVCSYQDADRRGFELETVRGRDAWLLVDNGNISAIRQGIARWVPVFEQAQVSDHPALADRARDGIAQDFDPTQSLRRLVHQLQVGGQIAVGYEDLTLPVLVAAGAQLPHAQWVSLAEDTQARAAEENRRLAAWLDPELLPGWAAGFQAVDYDTGVVAGRLAADREGPSTLGLGGLLGLSSSVEFLYVDGVREDLAVRVPAAYLRPCEAVFGFVRGIAAAGPKTDRSLHLLGLGVPILIPLVACAAHAAGLPLSLDSTSPIYDAHAGGGIRLYVDEPAPMKLRAAKVVQYWLDEDIAWNCPCPFCGDIFERFPHDIAAARRLRPITEAISDDDLTRTALADAMPYFAVPSDEQVGQAVRTARVRHNHWSLLRVRDRVRAAAAEDRLLGYAEQAVAWYAERAASAYWAGGVVAALELLRLTLSRMGRL